jgi:tetratricopeptide (TPR) repeat protein
MTAPRKWAPGTAVWLAAILLAGAALRGIYLRELEKAPDFTQPLADAAFHDYWARGWAEGTWTPPPGEPDPRIPEVPYLRPPGYPFFLSLVYRIAGSGPLAPRVAQMLLGLLNVLLAYRFGRDVVGRGAGLVLAAFAAGTWSSIYYEGELQEPVLVQTGAWLSLILLVAAARGGRAAAALAAGATLGWTSLVRANVVLFLPVAAIWLAAALRSRAGARAAWARAGLVLLGAALAIAPATARNHRVSGEFVPISANGAVNLYIGNHEGADGTTATLPDLEKATGRTSWSWFTYGEIVRGMSRKAGVPMTYGDASREFTRRAREWIAANPREFLALCARRAALFWGPNEISNDKAIALEKENSRVLRPFPGFAVVLAATLAGVVLAVRDARPGGGRRRGGVPSGAPARSPAGPAVDGAGLLLAALLVLTIFLSYVPFLAATRFRAPWVPVLFVFGAWAVRRLFDFVRMRQVAAALATIAAFAVLAWALQRGAGENPVDRAWWHTDRGVALARQERTDEARTEFEAALAANPGFVDAHVHLGDLLYAAGDREGALEHFLPVFQARPYRTDLMMKAAAILMELRRHEEASKLLEGGTRILPDSPEAAFEYGRVLIELGRDEEAVEALTRSLALGPGSAPTLTNRGIALARLGRHDEAVRDLEEAAELDRFSPETHFHLGNSLHALGRWEEAVEAYEQARRAGAAYVEPRVHLGNLYNERGRWQDAIRCYEEALRIAPDHVTARYNLAGSLGNAGRLAEAAEVLERALEVEPANSLCQARLRQIRSMLDAKR